MEEIKSGSGISNINWSTVPTGRFLSLIITKNNFHQFPQYLNHVDGHCGSQMDFFSIALQGSLLFHLFSCRLLDIRKQSFEVLCLCLCTYVNRTPSIIIGVRLKLSFYNHPPPPPGILYCTQKLTKVWRCMTSRTHTLSPQGQAIALSKISFKSQKMFFYQKADF
jgi:hypothetical protein